MVNQGLHVFFHSRPRWRGDLVVFDLHRARGDFVKALMDDAQGLAELFHTAQVPIVAVSVHSNGDIEFHLVVRVVGLRFSDIPRHAGTAEHDAGKRHVEGFGGGHDSDVFGASDPDTVVGEQFFGFVDAVAKLRRPLVDVVEEANGKVLGNAAGADVGGVEAGAGDAFVEFLSAIYQYIMKKRQ